MFFLTFAFLCCLNITTEAKEVTRHLKLFPTEIIDTTGQFKLETLASTSNSTCHQFGGSLNFELIVPLGQPLCNFT